ncbi:synaptic vesicle transporter [Macrophomina phaseolina]|uniref:Synaptic vesicle transporter n=1 Tax=Macrophomina phaseolina TaxID=35725 RepID=A0ABQ8GM11_9PEZI|nr:synaptic vesicle transporter [Macrophomina phaseolina]
MPPTILTQHDNPPPPDEERLSSSLDDPPTRPAIHRLESNINEKNYAHPLWRKSLIVFVTSWVTLAACFSSTSLFSAASEIALDLGTTFESVNISNAGVLLAMGFSSFVWGPVGVLLGRKIAYNLCIVVLLCFTIGAAVAPNMQTFVVMRVLSGLSGTYFHVSGQAILAEYFPPVQRGTATGFFLAGTVLGPPLGPLVAGIIVTYKSWRTILWLQAAMCGSGLLLSLLSLPPSPTLDTPQFPQMTPRQVLGTFNPSHVFQLFIYPNVLFTDLACGLLSWSQYALLSAPRHILTTRFHLTTPLISGLFYLSPAAGFLTGTMIGGRWSDHTVRKHIALRNGMRLPQDRLNSGMPAFFFVVPAASLVYGWSLEFDKGGLALCVVMAYFTALGLLAAFASLNTYCAEVLPRQRTSVIASKYCVQYCFAAAASGASVPMIDAIGVGATSTVGAAFVLAGGVLTLLTARFGLAMQDWVEERLGRNKVAEMEKDRKTGRKADYRRES